MLTAHRSHMLPRRPRIPLYVEASLAPTVGMYSLANHGVSEERFCKVSSDWLLKIRGSLSAVIRPAKGLKHTEAGRARPPSHTTRNIAFGLRGIAGGKIWKRRGLREACRHAMTKLHRHMRRSVSRFAVATTFSENGEHDCILRLFSYAVDAKW
ncbi:hypothetical protein M422DRAFT_249395 [Sphaerobolus stellatus SS14]|uniref:Uncharacterized protein n=1 Tax=Sphaerobolus stellatus (strain SS14) TaxID=990650 RepID=A0A0C9VVI0_SPHS4|nr:hypothetical protein M422DRAFT_249395 [Sphaerobolus stellatus SS14]